jgi:hypothetical protein
MPIVKIKVYKLFSLASKSKVKTVPFWATAKGKKIGCLGNLSAMAHVERNGKRAITAAKAPRVTMILSSSCLSIPLLRQTA